MHSSVIPGGNGFLRLIPRRGYIGVRASKGHQDLLTFEFFPVRVGTGNVAIQHALRALIRMKHKGQVGCRQRRGDHQAKAVAGDKCRDVFAISHDHLFRGIHRARAPFSVGTIFRLECLST
ncbi:hypothetical protein D3C80_1572890 [compost metagenome]